MGGSGDAVAIFNLVDAPDIADLEFSSPLNLCCRISQQRQMISLGLVDWLSHLAGWKRLLRLACGLSADLQPRRKRRRARRKSGAGLSSGELLSVN